MRRPWLTVHVGGQKWGVHIVTRRNKHLAGDAGCTILEDGQTYLASDLSEQAREDTLLHELLHAAFYVSGAGHELAKLCADPEAEDETEERIVRGLTPVIHRLLKDLGFHFPKGPT